jgi:hypothetical protein
MVTVASRRVATSLEPYDLMVVRLSWRLLDFLVRVAACRLLAVLVFVATLIVSVVVAVIVPSRVGSSSWGTTNMGEGGLMTLQS